MKFYHRHCAPKDTDLSEQWMTITCPVCSQSIEVECGPGALNAPTVRCDCGTVINNELGYFSRAA